ncbi:MAG: hypothetical protein IT226_15675 [Flavobacteriales bacterium]|nr:hypothetical protein [Flavobacteriales bacterium]
MSGLVVYPLDRFIVVAAFLTALTLISLWFITRTAPVEGERYVRGLRLARTLGLVSACVAFLVSYAVIKMEPIDNFVWLVVTAAFQCIVFVVYLIRSQQMIDGNTGPVIPDLPSRLRRINNQQLCIVTAALMVGMSFNATVSMVKRPQRSDIDSTAYDEAVRNIAILDTTKINLEGYTNVLTYDSGLFVGHSMMDPQQLLDTLRSINITIPDPLVHMGAAQEKTQHRITVWIFRSLWILVMFLWCYQLFPDVEVRMKHRRIDVGPTHGSSLAGSE